MTFIYTCKYILKEYVCVKLGNVPNSVNILFCLVYVETITLYQSFYDQCGVVGNLML